MKLKLKQNKTIFYSYKWDTILNSLLKFFPIDSPFNLYDISQQEKIEYGDFLTDGHANNNENTYIEITNCLIYNDFAKKNDFHNIILTDKGRKLVDYGSFKKYAQVSELRTKAEIRDLWVKKNWLFKIMISIILGILLTLGVQQLILFLK